MTVIDRAGNEHSENVEVWFDTSPPTIELVTPRDELMTSDETIEVMGQIHWNEDRESFRDITLTINGDTVIWAAPLELFSEIAVNIRNARHRDDPRPPDPDCPCPTCRTASRAYLRHLHMSGEMTAASLNFRDLMTVTGTYNPKQRLPLIPCSDGVRRVIAVGEGVSRVKVGDRVATVFFPRWGGGPPTPAKLSMTFGGPYDGVLTEIPRFCGMW